MACLAGYAYSLGGLICSIVSGPPHSRPGNPAALQHLHCWSKKTKTDLLRVSPTPGPSLGFPIPVSGNSILLGLEAAKWTLFLAFHIGALLIDPDASTLTTEPQFSPFISSLSLVSLSLPLPPQPRGHSNPLKQCFATRAILSCREHLAVSEDVLSFHSRVHVCVCTLATKDSVL